MKKLQTALKLIRNQPCCQTVSKHWCQLGDQLGGQLGGQLYGQLYGQLKQE